MSRLSRRTLLATSAAAAAGTALSGCGKSGSAGEPDTATIKIAYQKFGNFTQLDDLMKSVKKEFEEKHSGSKLELVVIEAQQNDYITKLALMNRSKDTAPDLMYEDTFMIRSDVDAGYLMELDEHLADWEDWDQFVDAAKEAGKADDGKTYGVSLGTDTRGIWYNRELLKKVGITGDWQPKAWDEILDVARKIKKDVPGVIPLNLYSGKPMGEGSVMQGFEMLLYGTKDGTLYDMDAKKWVVGSQQFKDSLEFVRTIYVDGLAPTPQQALDVNVGTKVGTEWLPKSKLAMNVDGSWMPGQWLKGEAAEWPEWNKTMGWCGMPTQNGQEPGMTSMSGGWTLAMGANCEAPTLAFEAMKIALDKKHALQNYINNSQIAVRKDCASDPKYLGANPSVKFFTDLVEKTNFRPATPDYPQISNAIAVAMEEVMTGKKSVAEAAAAYDKAVEAQVGKDGTVSR